jgi:hypothetical protein
MQAKNAEVPSVTVLLGFCQQNQWQAMQGCGKIGASKPKGILSMENRSEQLGSTNWNFRQGLSGNAIKVIGVVLMVFDHLHQMFIAQAPVWFNMLGRPVLPIFIFMCAEGFYHTRSRKRYITLLFVSAVAMNIGNWVLSRAMRIDPAIPEHGVQLINNVFTTMLMTALCLESIELVRYGIKEKKPGKIAGGVGIMFGMIAFSVGLLLVMRSADYSDSQILITAFLIIPNLFTGDGILMSEVLGIAFYYLRKWRWAQMAVLAAFSAFSFYTAIGSGYNIQWMQVFAIVPLLLYNGKRGKGSKYFFYIFYPAHIWGLYAIAWALQR